MRLVFVGCGSAFSVENYQSNMLLEASSGRRLLIDCGGTAHIALAAMGLRASDINDVYISHLHGDHIGGLEWLGFCTYFSGKARPYLYAHKSLIRPLWQTCLRGGMSSIQGQRATLDTFFDVHPIRRNGHFTWEGVRFQLVRSIHVMDGFDDTPSYGLMWKIGDTTYYLTTDAQHAPHQIQTYYNMADVVFQDCETAPCKSGVHAHYSELASLGPETRSKMWLYHYQDGPLPDAKADGFRGFIRKGQVFDL